MKRDRTEYNREYYKKNREKLNEYQRKKYKKKKYVDNEFRNELGQFKKGQKPHNYKPIGSEFIRNDGYIMIKVDEHKWKQKHRYIYEQHYGKIPKGYSIIFLDQNKTNCNIDNLMLVKKSEKLMTGKYGLLSNNKELTKTGILTMQLIMKTYKIKKGES